MRSLIAAFLGATALITLAVSGADAAGDFGDAEFGRVDLGDGHDASPRIWEGQDCFWADSMIEL